MTRGVIPMVAVFLAALSVWAQPLLPAVPPQNQGPLQSGAMPPIQAPPKAPLGKMYAMRASGTVPQGPSMDEKLKPIASVLESLPFTSYEAISVVDRDLPWAQETLFPINAVYAMHVTAQQQEPDGAIPLRARVEMLQGEDYVNALDTSAKAAQNQALLFRGMPLGQDELVIVLVIALPQDEKGQGESSPEDQSRPEGEGENQEQPESETNKQDEGDQESQEDKTAEEQQESREDNEGENEQPEGVKNMDALLQSLDDIDKREQVEERNRRDRIDFKGDWW